MLDYPFWDECDLADRLRCVAVEADAAGLPWPMLRAIRKAVERLEALDEGSGEELCPAGGR